MDPFTRPEFGAVALVTIDTQVDTLDGQPFEVPGTSAILPAMARLCKLFREKGRPIVHIVRLYSPDGSNAERCRRAIIIEGGAVPFRPGSPGSEIAGELLPDPSVRLDATALLSGRPQRLGPSEVVIYKPRWGAFYRTPLEEHLQRCEVSTLVFAGCNYPNCPRTSIYEASERDYRLVLVEDAMSNLDERGKTEMGGIGVALMAVSQVEGALGGC